MASAEAGVILHAIQAGEGPPVVILHGLFGAARNFGAIQRATAQQFHVIALDMRNHGDSPHEDGMRYPDLAKDVQQTLRNLGITRAAVIGHSMGGKAAMALALQSPDLVGRLLVCDIAPVSYQHGNTAFTTAMQAIPLTPALTRRDADTVLAATIQDETLRPFLLQNLRLGPRPHWRIGLDEIAAAIPDLEGWTQVPGRYDGPALFVTGVNSGYVSAEHQPVIRDLFPNARFVAIKNAGHWVHADNPAGFLSVVEAFLRDWR